MEAEDQGNQSVQAPPARQDTATDDVVYVAMCSGVTIILPAAERARFEFGQFIASAVALFLLLLTLLIYSL